MTAMPTFPSGHQPPPAELQALLPNFVRKTSDQTIASNTTLQNDNALSLSSMDAAGIYRVELFVLFRATNATNGGMKTTFTLPTGADYSNGVFELATNKAPASGGTVSGITAGTSNAFFGLTGLLVMDGTHTGTFQFQWAQNSSSANGTIVAAGSYLWLQRMA